MELQRIIARDTRSATEQALSRFGPNVFVISNHRVAGQTELVVAVDVQAPSQDDDEVLVASPVLNASPVQATSNDGQASFEAKLHAVMAKKAAAEQQDDHAPPRRGCDEPRGERTPRRPRRRAGAQSCGASTAGSISR